MMNRIIRPKWLVLGFAAAAAFIPAAGAPYGKAYAGDIMVAAGGVNARPRVKSIAERRYDTVIRQQYDFSCGSAAVASLLTYHYGRPTSESDAFKAMWAVGDQTRIRELGFSLLEMKSFIEGMGLKADGFRVTLDRVQEIGVPGIALIEVKGYRHFVVVKGVTDRTVLIGDPSAGVISKPRREFEKHWDGTILFIRSEVARGKENFNKSADWRIVPSGPFDRALDAETLQSVSLNQTRPGFSGFTINTIVER